MMNLADPGVRVYYLFLGYSEKELGEEYNRQTCLRVVETCRGFHDDYGLREFIEDSKRNHHHGN